MQVRFTFQLFAGHVSLSTGLFELSVDSFCFLKNL